MGQKPKITAADVTVALEYMKTTPFPDDFYKMPPSEQAACERQAVRGMLIAVETARAIMRAPE